MSKFVIALRETGNELIAAECLALTGATPQPDGLAFCEDTSEVKRSAYLRWGGNVLVRAPSLEELLTEVRRKALRFDEFRVEFVRLGNAPPLPSQKSIVAVADALKGCFPNLDHPKVRLALVVGATEVLLGEIRTESDRSYTRHDAKPYTTSSSLPSRLSRALVNLVAQKGDVVLDPCCGVGTLLLEAAAVGAIPVGCDWNLRMVEKARANLSHFGYAGTIHHADARTWHMPVDAVVTDLPYGRNTVMSPNVVRGILSAVARVATRAVFVALADVRSWMEEAGFSNVRVYAVPKYRGFVRRVHVGESVQRS